MLKHATELGGTAKLSKIFFKFEAIWCIVIKKIEFASKERLWMKAYCQFSNYDHLSNTLTLTLLKPLYSLTEKGARTNVFIF